MHVSLKLSGTIRGYTPRVSKVSTSREMETFHAVITFENQYLKVPEITKPSFLENALRITNLLYNEPRV